MKNEVALLQTNKQKNSLSGLWLLSCWQHHQPSNSNFPGMYFKVPNDHFHTSYCYFIAIEAFDLMQTFDYYVAKKYTHGKKRNPPLFKIPIEKWLL